MPPRYITAAIALAALVVALFMMRPRSEATGNVSSDPPMHEMPLAQAPSHVVMLPIAADAIRLNAPGGNCRDDIAFLDLVISQYGRLLDGNPVGDNRAISAALRGDNPKGIAFLPSKGAFLDADEHLVDRWGTPYFFHAIASQRMDIVSAGPDREFWTADDITGRPGGH